MSNTIYNGSYPSIAENYVYSSTGTSKVKTKSDTGSNTAKTSDTAAIKDTSTAKNTKADGKVAVNGQTIGNPRLSEKASKYYDQLKKKYSNMNFILVSEDQKNMQKHRLQAMPMLIIWLFLLMRIKLSEWLKMRITASSMKE